MKASETKIEDFMATNKAQFIIPVYQRNYDWSIPQCKQLLNGPSPPVAGGGTQLLIIETG